MGVSNMKRIILSTILIILILGGSLYLLNDRYNSLPKAEGNPMDDNTILKEFVAALDSKQVEETQQEPTVGFRKGNIAADFTLENLEGQQVSLSDYRGQKLILNFWSTECPSCREEMPNLNQFYLERKEENITVVGVNIGESQKKVAEFMEAGGYEFPMLLDQQQEVSYQYGIIYIPSTFFINEAGVIEEIHVGYITVNDLNKRYEK